MTVAISLPTGHIENANCYDCIFTSDNAGTTLLNWETESYASGSLVAHVLISNLSSGVNTPFYIFYGKAGVSSFQGGALASAWDSNYVSILHLGSLPSSAVDSITGTSGTIANVTAAAGEIDGAGGFNGTAASIDLGTGAGLQFGTGDFTVSAWFNSASSGYQMLVGKETALDTNQWLFGINGLVAGSVWLWDRQGSVSASIPYTASAWQQAVCTRASAVLTCYLNASPGSPTSGSTGSLSDAIDINIGKRAYTGNEQWFNGTIDEVRLSKVARPATWITTEYNNQQPGSTFLALGSEVAYGVAASRVRHRVTQN